jgi:hypothetical protein
VLSQSTDALSFLTQSNIFPPARPGIARAITPPGGAQLSSSDTLEVYYFVKYQDLFRACDCGVFLDRYLANSVNCLTPALEL